MKPTNYIALSVASILISVAVIASFWWLVSTTIDSNNKVNAIIKLINDSQQKAQSAQSTQQAVQPQMIPRPVVK